MKNIERIKHKMKEEYAKKVDSYFEMFEEEQKNKTLDIDKIETLLGKGISDVRDVLLETSEELLKTETDEDIVKKKPAPPAKKH